jgi:hypothetical protein
MTSKTTDTFSPEVRTRAVRLVLDRERSHDLLARRRIRIDCPAIWRRGDAPSSHVLSAALEDH